MPTVPKTLHPRRRVDYLESGSGPAVILVHSSMAGARQWKALTAELEPDYHVRAVNLFGYGATPPWPHASRPSLDDYADLVAAAIPHGIRNIKLIGHSFGGAVAMRVAQREGSRIGSLVLIEPSLFPLLRTSGRDDAFTEIQTLARDTLQQIANAQPEHAAARFIDYWCGVGSWASMPDHRRTSTLAAITQLSAEWPALLEHRTTIAELQQTLPSNTLLMSFSDSVRPSREVADILAHAFPYWLVVTIAYAGHMAPLTHPHLVNAVIREFLAETRTALVA